MTRKTTISKDVLYNLRLTSSREFKALKRYQLRELERAYGEYELGCAHCPNYDSGTQNKLEAIIKELRESHSAKNWGR